MSDTDSTGGASHPIPQYYARKLYSRARSVLRSAAHLGFQLGTSRHYTIASVFVAVVSGAILLAGAHPGGNSSQSIYVLSLAPHPNEVALAEQRLWSDLTAQFHEAAQQTNTEVRVGYFGLCARLINQSGWECTKNGESLFTRLGPDATDTINILRLADDFKSSVLFPGLVIGAMALSVLCFIGLSTTIDWHRQSGRHVHSGSEISIVSSHSAVMRLCVASSALASVLMLAAALWQHVAAACAVAVIEGVAQGYISGCVGGAAASLVWLSFATTAMTTFGAWVMYRMAKRQDCLWEEA